MKKLLPIIIIGALIIISGLVSLYAPKPLDWTPTFDFQDKNPYGTYIAAKLAKSSFRDFEINEKSFYQLSNSKFKETNNSNFYNYILITNDWQTDSLSSATLLDFVYKGNLAFISCSQFPKQLQDTLKAKIKVDYAYSFFNDSSKTQDTFNVLKFSNWALSFKEYYLSKRNHIAYFYEFDTNKTTVLGTFKYGKVNFIAVKFGEGYFFLNTANYAFTNYNLAKNGPDYIETALSYLPKMNETVFDNYFSPLEKKSSSPLRYILSNQALKNAFYLCLISLLLFVLIKIKRTQRIIPIIHPIKNATLEFASTISNLYLQKKNNQIIAKKKANHFLDFVRTKLNINIDILNDLYTKRLSDKTGLDIAFLNEIVNKILLLNIQENISDEELIKFSKNIDKFYSKVNYGKYE